MPFGSSDIFIPIPLETRGISAWPDQGDQFAVTNDQKKQFGIELSKLNDQFKAACKVFPNDVKAAMWMSNNLITDPIVLVSKELSAQEANTSTKLLDKESLGARLLSMSEEKHPNGVTYLMEDKERLSALKLYADIMGLTSANQINNFNNANFNHKELKITVVRPEKKEEPKPIIGEIIENEVDNINPLPLTLKLVKKSIGAI